VLLLLVGAEPDLVARLGHALSRELSWPFHDAIAGRPDALEASIAEEIALDARHAADAHGSRIVATWHIGLLVRATRDGRPWAAAYLPYVRMEIDWTSVLAVEVRSGRWTARQGQYAARELAVVRRLGGTVAPMAPVVRHGAEVDAARFLAPEIRASLDELGDDDPVLVRGNA
jgi:hypothetical protein